MDLGADGPFAAGGGCFDRLLDDLRRADDVGPVDHFHPAFGVDEDADVRTRGADPVHVLGLEDRVDRAVAFPQDDPGRVEVRGGHAAVAHRRAPERHLLERDPHRAGGVPPQVLVREEQHLAALGERPLHHRARVRRRADDAAVPTAERL